MKKLVAAMMILISLFSTTVSAAETILPRSEIPIAEAEAEALVRLGLLNGTENGLELQRNVTRAEAAVMALRVSGICFNDIGYIEPSFTDIENHWAADTVEKLYHGGYINGTGNNLFEPERSVTGREFAKMLLSLTGYTDVTINNVYENGKTADLLNNNFTKSVVYGDETLLRSDAARLCFHALTSKTPNGKMLYELLTENGVYKAEDFEGVLFGACVVENKTFADKLNSYMPDDKNYMFSPFSVKTAFALAANGAEGATRDEILNTLGIDDLDEFNEYSKTLIEAYGKTENLTLKTANSIWVNKSKFPYDFKEDYKNKIIEYYNGEAETVDDNSAVEKINSWTNEHTNGKIPSIIDNSEFLAFLENAVYFKGAWQNEFSESATKKDIFTDKNGESKETDFMNRRAYIQYFSDGCLQIVKLPYKNVFGTFSDDGEYLGSEDFSSLDISMFLLMNDNEINNAEALLVNAGFENRYADLSVPKFKIEFSASLNDIMRNMGIVSAFSDKTADFANMFEQKGIFISDTIYKTYISVDEKGTEAAAVTGISMGATSLPPEPIEVKFNKPFTFIIRDNTNGEILFMGEYSYIY